MTIQYDVQRNKTQLICLFLNAQRNKRQVVFLFLIGAQRKVRNTLATSDDFSLSWQAISLRISSLFKASSGFQCFKLIEIIIVNGEHDRHSRG